MDVDEDIAAAAALGQQLIDAILAQEPRAQVQALVDSGAPLWFQAPDGISALHAAAYAQDAELVGSLLEKGAVWNAGEQAGMLRTQRRANEAQVQWTSCRTRRATSRSR
jgi:protein arginine N-methyltransferase 2